MIRIALPARADRSAAEQLLPELRSALATDDLCIDGKAVTQIGQAMLQLLIAAGRTARAADRRLAIEASETMRATLEMAGAGALLDGGSL